MEDLWAWTAKDLQGEEGIIAVPTDFGPMPLISARRDVAEAAERSARMAATARGYDATLKHFHLVEVVATVHPASAN